MKKQLTIMGTVWDFWAVLHEYDRTLDSKYISFYKPWLKGEIDKKKIVLFNEKRKSTLFLPFKILVRTIKIQKEINKFNPDYVVSHHDDASMSVFFVILINKYLYGNRKIKFIGYLRSGASYYLGNDFYPRFLRTVGKYIYRHFDLILTPSIGNRDSLRKIFPKVNIGYKYNMINKKLCLEKTRKGFIEKQDEKYFKRGFVFLSIGRLTEQKAYWNLIRTFRGVVDKNPDSVLLIIGEGELENKLELLIKKLNLEDNVKLLGFRKNVFPYIKRANCFILPSLWESFGNVIIESLALKKLVISTDCKSGPREIMAPELKQNQKIKYPYNASYGILVEPFKRKFVFQTIKEFPLTKQELELQKLLLKVISNSKLRKRYESLGEESIERFEVENQIKSKNLAKLLEEL